MHWLDDEDGDLVNIEQAQMIAVRETEATSENDPKYAVVAIFNANEAVWLFSGEHNACVEFRNMLRPRLKRSNSFTSEIEVVPPRIPGGMVGGGHVG